MSRRTKQVTNDTKEQLNQRKMNDSRVMEEIGAQQSTAAERRRAARQRKILENAQSRMNRLCGRPETDPASDGPSVRTSSSVTERVDPCPDPPDQSIDEILLRSRSVAGPAAASGWPPGLAGDGAAEALLRRLNGAPLGATMPDGAADGAPVEASIWWQRWDQYRWIVFSLLALATRLLMLAGLGSYLAQNVLVPFFVLEVTVYLFRLFSVPLRPNMGLVGTALMLCGISPQTLDLWGRYFTFLSHAWNDFLVYMFVLVLSFRLVSPAAEPGTSGSETRQQAAPPPPERFDDVEYEFLS